MDDAIIIACSHRRGGNTDHAAQLLANGVCSAGGTAKVIHLRNHEIMPCLACGFCDKAVDRQGRDRCVLGAKDDAYDLFAKLFTARTVLFTSPIYFYHLPSLFKTWIDRSQQFWTAHREGQPWMADLPRRTAHTVLVAGRPEGARLFEGAALTIKYFLHNFNLTLADPVLLRGVDARNDLNDRPDLEERITALGATAWRSD